MSVLKEPYFNVSEIENKFVELYGEDFAKEQKGRYQKIFDKFKKKFNQESCYFASSSGRVEVLGNHTDHNGGCVMSCAISLDTLACFLPNDENCIRIESEGYPEFSVDLNNLSHNGEANSASLTKGVAYAVKKYGYRIGGFNACITSNVLGGAGISSSASFEVLIAEILNFLYNDGNIDAQTKAFIAQYAENVYFNKPCGLLDQTAISFGGLNVLDFRDTSKIGVTPIKIDKPDFTFVLINTGGSHADLTDEYASIPREMKQVANFFSKERLIEVDENDFYKNVSKLSDVVSDRAILRTIHFFRENKRVLDAARLLGQNDIDGFLSCVKESGISSLSKLQNCYVPLSNNQVIPRTLAIVEEFIEDGAVRVHGGGFAGCVLSVVKNTKIKSFTEQVSEIFGQDNVIVLSVRKNGTITL